VDGRDEDELLGSIVASTVGEAADRHLGLLFGEPLALDEIEPAAAMVTGITWS
jgi:hypothetical protein